MLSIRAGARLGVAAVLVTPAALFVAANLLRSVAGIAAPYDLLAMVGGALMDFRTFNLVSPVLFIGGAAAALLLILPVLVRFRSKVERGVLSVSSVELVARPSALIIATLAILSAAATAGVRRGGNVAHADAVGGASALPPLVAPKTAR